MIQQSVTETRTLQMWETQRYFPGKRQTIIKNSFVWAPNVRLRTDKAVD